MVLEASRLLLVTQLREDKLDQGDLQWNNDFRGTYATLLEKWMGVDANPVLGGQFEQFDFIK